MIARLTDITDARARGARRRLGQVGVLEQGGWANWFTSQTEGDPYTAHGPPLSFSSGSS